MSVPLTGERGMLDDIRAWARERETPEHGGMLWLGLVVALMLLLPAASPRMGIVFWGFVLFVTLLVSLRFRIGPAAMLVMVVGGVAIRLVLIGASSSDALIVTVAAIERVLGGGGAMGDRLPADHPARCPIPVWAAGHPLVPAGSRPARGHGGRRFDRRPRPARHPRATRGPGHLRLRADAHGAGHGRIERHLGLDPAARRHPGPATLPRLGWRRAGGRGRLQDLRPGLAAGPALVRAPAGPGRLRAGLPRALAAGLHRLGAGRLPRELPDVAAGPPAGVLLAGLCPARDRHTRRSGGDRSLPARARRAPSPSSARP